MADEKNYGVLAGVTNGSTGGEPAGGEEADGMSDESLLSMLQAYERDSSEYTTDTLRKARDEAVKAYYQRPYGNEEEGWAQVVTSTVADTVEWMLPDVMDQFMSTDDAVRFDPTNADDVKSAQAATDGCNYIFHKQNNGFMILHTIIKDALMLRTCAVHWRVEEKRVRSAAVFQGPDSLSVLLAAEQQGKYDPANDTVVSEDMVPGPMVQVPPQAPGQPPQMVQGPPQVRIRIQRVEKRRRIRIDAFEPENLRVFRNWTSPILDECPYVGRDLEITLSDLNELCEQLEVPKVEASELRASQEPNSILDNERLDRTGDSALDTRKRSADSEIESEDPTQTTGWIRIEWVRADYDGDGVAELREIYRLQDRILSNEECDAIPCATGSPILVPHKWDGQSVAETLLDLQKTHTDIMRGVLNNAWSSNNPRKVVLVDKNGAPAVNMDDLLDTRPGGNLRTFNMDGIRMEPTAYVGNQFMPLLDMLDNQVEKRSGVTRQRMGMDPNAINNDRTLGETRIMDQASKQRIKLVCRSIAETVLVQVFKGLLKTATSGKIDPLFFKLRGEFVEIDPNEWRDGYDMSVNVGLGTGDREAQEMALEREFQTQMGLLPTPIGPAMVTPEQVYNTRAKLLALRGFKNTGDFYTKPPPGPMQMPPPPPPEAVLVAQLKAQTEAQKFQAESRQEYEKSRMENERKLAEQLQQNELQRQNDERDAAREMAKVEADRQIKLEEIASKERIASESNKTSILTATIAHPEAAGMLGNDQLDDMRQALALLIEMQGAPKSIVRDPATGEVMGVQHGSAFRPVQRDDTGGIVGIQ